MDQKAREAGEVVEKPHVKLEEGDQESKVKKLLRRMHSSSTNKLPSAEDAESRKDRLSQAEGGEQEKSYEMPDLQFSEDEDDTFASEEVRKKKAAWRRLRRLYNRFTSKMRIPCYNKMQYFYYYDVLEGLSRILF